MCAEAPVNTFDVRMLELFTSTIKSLEADPAVEGMILTSAFPKVFSAGLDIPALVNPTEEEFRHFWSTFEGLVSTYYMTPLHSVAAIAGNTPALGAVLSICSDYRVMADDDKAKFGLNETSLGMVPPRWLAGMTARTIGERNAELHLGGSSMLSPREALQCGFLDEVCTREELMARAVAASVKACRIPLGARSAYKQMVRKPVADMCGPASVDEMSACILGAEFQATASAIMEALRQRSKKK
jgi:3,2-trans-enoyl-CoA isomerase